MEVYTVIWSSACYEVHDDVMCLQEGIHGICQSETSAQALLEECKQNFIDEVLNDQTLSEDDIASFEANLQIRGSISASYFVLNYEQDESPVEVHIQITHTYIQD